MLYKEREIDELDTYIDHVSAMTTEGLHSKSAIAAELAFRDSHIQFLENGLDECTVNAVANFGAWLVNNHEADFSGGEDHIAKLCSDFIEQHSKTLDEAS